MISWVGPTNSCETLQLLDISKYNVPCKSFIWISHSQQPGTQYVQWSIHGYKYKDSELRVTKYIQEIYKYKLKVLCSSRTFTTYPGIKTYVSLWWCFVSVCPRLCCKRLWPHELVLWADPSLWYLPPAYIRVGIRLVQSLYGQNFQLNIIVRQCGDQVLAACKPLSISLCSRLLQLIHDLDRLLALHESIKCSISLAAIHHCISCINLQFWSTNTKCFQIQAQSQTFGLLERVYRSLNVNSGFQEKDAEICLLNPCLSSTNRFSVSIHSFNYLGNWGKANVINYWRPHGFGLCKMKMWTWQLLICGSLTMSSFV